jgi:hypothetical protein
LFDHVLFHFSEVKTLGRFLDFEGMQFFLLLSIFIEISSVFGVELVLEFAALLNVVFHFFVPEVVEVVHFLLVGFVDLVDLILVSNFHFVNPSVIQLFSKLLGLNPIVLGLDVIAVFLILGHYYQHLV